MQMPGVRVNTRGHLMPEDYAAIIPYRSGWPLLLPRAMLTLAGAVLERRGEMSKSVALLQPRSVLRSMALVAIRVQLLRV